MRQTGDLSAAGDSGVAGLLFLSFVRDYILIMNSMEKLKSAFAEGLGLDGTADYDNLAYGSTTGWDSVAHMAVIARIESAFDIMLSTDDVIDMSSFDKAKQIVAKYGVPFEA